MTMDTRLKPTKANRRKTTRKSTSTSSDDRKALAASYDVKADLQRRRQALGPRFTVHIPPAQPVVQHEGKATSPEMATLASDYLDLEPPRIARMTVAERAEFARDVRRLAASVLSQFEGARP